MKGKRENETKIKERNNENRINHFIGQKNEQFFNFHAFLEGKSNFRWITMCTYTKQYAAIYFDRFSSHTYTKA